MSLERKYSIYRKIAVFMAVNILVQIVAPTAAWALTGGPSSPEFSSFEPVATTNMVSEFSGDLTYNLPVIDVPGANGGGYAMSLSYHSGASSEEEASWVGYGWTLNPGAINRGKKGFPDDWDGESVKYHNQTPANQTIAIGGSLGEIETFSYNVPINVNSSIRYNNYKGFGYTIGAGISLAKGVVSLGYNVSDGTGSFSLSVNPAGLLSKSKENGKEGDKEAKKSEMTKEQKKEAKKAADGKRFQERKNELAKNADRKLSSVISALGSGYGIHNFASASYPTQIVGYTGISTTVSLNVLIAPSPFPAGVAAGAFGSYSRQENTSENNLSAFGYMYSSNAGADDMMDYFVEKGSAYTKQDKFLGIPFNNADNYSLTGEGLSGGFQLSHRNVGRFHPNHIESETFIFNITPEVNVGLDNGAGTDVGAGYQTLEVEEWIPSTNNGFSTDGDEPVFFRFANDKGGELTYDGGNISKKRANIQLTSYFPGNKSATANETGIDRYATLDFEYGRSLRSSYIGYNTNSNMIAVEDTVTYKAYAQKTNSNISNASIDRSTYPKQIGEFSIVNEDGQRYNYGVPILSKNEKNIQVDLNGVGASNIENRFLVYRDITGSTETKVGEERSTPYATSYLLTGITSPDYIDRTNNGPSDDDFGGYTKFIYEKIHSNYKWRMPYAGLSYNRNELSNPKDDLGSVAEGKKEIFYLDSVVTKTHYAVFYTSDRRDGLDANNSEFIASTNFDAMGSNKLKKLDKIELYAKNLNGGSDKLIKTVHFEYNYSLCRGVLNSLDKSSTNLTEGGKLTLKKVWFEYNGVVEAKISPYQFEYNYPTTAQADYPTRYNSFENYGSGLTENPSYSPFSIDAWGNYQNDGSAKYEDMKSWLNQNANADSVATFDPAAWQLKVIKLPSGGEIHVQYEQDDYCYVQDKEAHAMVSLLGGNHETGSFTVNTLDLGIENENITDKHKLAAIIAKEYITKGKKIYFKMLYKLIGDATPYLNDCNVEYVTGYANVSHVYVNDSYQLVIKLKQGGYNLPQQVCEDYVTTQRAGNLAFVGSNCDPEDNGIGNGNATSKVLGFVGRLLTWVGSLAPGTTCLEMNYEYSYLRIPLLDAKKGGGVRVKRLLMFDKGLDTGTPELYGSEYIYKTFDENRKEYRSSGVATNEPAGIREENALVEFMDRFKQSWIDKAVSGRDKEQSEGPLGESILPGPSVGYSKIITKNIHSGKTNPGFSVKEFYTAKDYPVKMEMTGIDQEKDYLPIITGLINDITNNLWVSQGFSFIINSMHGQIRSSSTYAGDYADILNPKASTLVSREEMTYFQPGEELPILDTKDLSYTSTMPLGKDMDMVIETKRVRDVNTDGNIEMDADVGVIGVVPIPFLIGCPSLTYSESEINTHVTTKITSYPAILKSTKSYADGIYHLSENIAFNRETGQPIMVRTTDGFDKLNLLASNNHDGSYTKYSFPASLEYENMSQKAKNERKVVSSSSVSIKKIIESGKEYLLFSALTDTAQNPPSVCNLMANFIGGDLVKLSSGGVYHIGDVYGNKIEIQPTYYSTQIGVASPENVSITVEIIKSGRTNQLNTMVGSITTYGKDSVIITPVDSATLWLRQEFAGLLTNSLTEGDTIFASDIPEGIEFVNSNGSCSALDTNQFILVEGNMVNIYSLGGNDTIIIPNHPMVDTLNYYLNYFYDYDLDTTGGYTVECGSLQTSYNGVVKISNTSYSTMREEQDLILSRQFFGINGGTDSIASYFEAFYPDDTTKATVVTGTPSRLINKKVLLEEIATGNIYGNDISCEYNVAGVRAYYCSECIIENDTTIECSFRDGNQVGQFIETEDGYLAHLTDTSEYFCPTNVRFYYINNNAELICSSEIQKSGWGGHFEIDPKTAALEFYAADNSCQAQDIPCIRFCSELYPSTAITRVVASEANTIDDHWDYDEILYSATGNDYELGKRGKWRTYQTYIFKTDVDRLSSSPISYNKNYNSGTYNLELFNWNNLGANGQKWLALNTVKKYSPNGNALEEENILGIKSSAKFGYHKTLPYFIAQNADYNSVMFESFENVYDGTKLEDAIVLYPLDGTIDTTTSHSGRSSFQLTFPANDGVELTEMLASNQMLNKGMLFKVWIKTDAPTSNLLDNYLEASLEDVENNLSVSMPFKKVAQSGEWYLYQAKILPADISGFDLGDAVKTYIKYNFSAPGNENVWIDDVRIQPMDAKTTAYVYDIYTHRLITTFDDQHFGLFYQYNAEGKLVRKLIETVKGKKTVQETEYNTPKKSRE